MRNISRFAWYAWGVVAYNLFVIAWGAYVRATGSGAGCGNHWPLCNGEVIPRAPQVETLIEFSHRLTSGAAGLLVIALVVWAFRRYPPRHIVRRGAIASLVLIIIEGLLGAGLVRFELVADNASMFRAFSMMAHLVNTFILVAALTLTAWWASGGRPLRLRGQGVVGWMLAAGLLGVLVLGMSGAVTALGDTLFPAGSLAEGIRQDFDPTAHLLLRLRVFHPLIAMLVGIYLIVTAGIASMARPAQSTRRLARALSLLFVIQVIAGMVNVALLAPVWMQLVHLLLADLVWIALVLLAAATLAEDAEPARIAERVGSAAPTGA